MTLGAWLAPLLVELVYTRPGLAMAARELGYADSPRPWNAERRSEIIARLDAAWFVLYGLSRDDVSFALDTFTLLRQRDIARHAAFRTKDLVLREFDSLTAACVSSASNTPRM